MLFIELIKLRRNYSLPSVNLYIFFSDYKTTKKNLKSKKEAKNPLPRLTIHKKTTQTTLLHSQPLLLNNYSTVHCAKIPHTYSHTRVAHPLCLRA